MKKLLKALTGRMVIVSLLIFVQLGFVLGITLYLTSVSGYILMGLELLSLLVVIWLVSKDENPSYKLAWVILILMLPITGILFFVLFGNKRMPRYQEERIRTYTQKMAPHRDVCESPEMAGLHREDEMLGRQADYIANVSGFSVYRNTACQYCELGEVLFKSLMEELGKAKRFILMEYFIIQQGEMWDPIFELLQRKVREGVEVRLLYDDMGSIQTVPNGFDKTVAATGIHCAAFNPYRPHVNGTLNYRDHRKICVIDGNVGFTGGINLADEYINVGSKLGHWKDTAVMLKGDAVWTLTLMFMQLWCFRTGEDLDFTQYRPTETFKSDGYVQPYGDSPLDNLNVAENVYMQIVNSATRYLYITTPYLILDNEMVTALIIAAQSGVDVRIMTPHVPDKWFVHPVTRSFYLPLISAGVKIYEYSPGFVHAKMFVCDDKVAIVGTANMDYRSFYLHFECGAAFYYSSVVSAVKQDILATLEKCQRITQQEAYSNFWYRFGRALLRIFAPLM